MTAAGIARLKAANRIEDVIGERGIRLKKKGKQLFALCPFHKEKSASFCVTAGGEEGHFHCFGCGASGDVIGFLVKHDGVTFREAVKTLCRRAGLRFEDVVEEDPKRKPKPQPKTPIEALTPPPAEVMKAKASTTAKKERTAAAPRSSARGSAPASTSASSASEPDVPGQAGELAPGAALALVVDHYHRKLGESPEALDYLSKKRGLEDFDLLRAHKVGFADGSLLRAVPKSGRLREQLVELGVITKENRELLGGCIVVPIPDPLTGQWTTLYGRGIKTPRHCYLPGPLRGVLNFQAARLSDEIVLTESVLDALSFHQAGVATAIPIYGTHGFLVSDHLDMLKREGVKRVILALDSDEPGRKAAAALKEKLTEAGIAVRIASFPAGIKDANELLVSRNGDAGIWFRQVLGEAEPRPSPNPAGPRTPEPAPPSQVEHPAKPVEASSTAPVPELGDMPASPATVAAPDVPPAANATPNDVTPNDAASAAPHNDTPNDAPNDRTASVAPAGTDRVLGREGDEIVLRRLSFSYRVSVHGRTLGRLRATVKLHDRRCDRLHVDSLDLYASKSRAEYARRASKLLGDNPESIEADLMAILVEAEKLAGEENPEAEKTPTPMSDAERTEALIFLKDPALLKIISRDIETLGFVGEDINTRLLYLVATSRKLKEPLSAVILSQSGAGKSGLAQVIEEMMPPEDVVMLTRLTPQSLYYTEPGFLDRKVIIVEERHGSEEADYSIRVFQSRGKLIAAAPVKDPQTGNLRTKIFQVEGRAAFIEATTASAVNHENATRCFELTMDESEQQTERIHQRQRLMKTEAGLALKEEAERIRTKHRNAQRLLEPLPVIIPYADKLSFPAKWMRTRRDNARFLNLIEVLAFLHQHQRERRGGAIVASLSDYAAAYALASGVLVETLSDVKKPLREAYGRIRAMCEKAGGSVSRREVREELGQPDSTVRRWLGELGELEYLEVEGSKGGQGKSARYRLSERAPRHEIVLGLLTPEQLRAQLEK